MRPIITNLILILLLPIIPACLTSRYSRETCNMTINQYILESESIRLIMKNGQEYYISEDNMAGMEMDSISLSTQCQVIEEGVWKGARMSIPFDSIKLIQISKKDPGKSLIVYGGIITLATMMGFAQAGPDPPEVYVPSAGSCPFIYSWTGDSYVLEGEAIGAGFGKGLELETSCMLPSLQEDNSQLKLRITNERPETHYINSVQLLAFEIDSTAVPYFDSFNNIWPVYHPKPALFAKDHSNSDVTLQLKDADGNYWESDLTQCDLFSDFKDKIYLTFNKPTLSQEVTLIIHTINTHIANFIFDHLFRYLGDQSLAFIHAVENDAHMIHILKKWLIHSSLKASIWDGQEWQQVGQVYPEANEVPFTKVMHFNTENIKCDTLKVRLSCLADLWKIDAAFFDTTAVEPIKANAVTLHSAIKNDNQDVFTTLAKIDDRYMTMLPPQYVDLIYEPYREVSQKKVSYGIQVQGYLHEWIIQDSHPSLITTVDFIPQSFKIAYLKKLLHPDNKSIFLPPLYAEWKKIKQGKMKHLFD